MSIGDIKVPSQQMKDTNQTKVEVATSKSATATNNTPARETGGSRKSLADIAQAVHTAYRQNGLLELPEEIKTFLKSQNIHYRWVANKATRLSEMRLGRGYEYLHESHLPPKLQGQLQGFKRLDGTYGSPADDLVLMILGEKRAEELRQIRNQNAEDQIRSAQQRIEDNKAMYDKSTTKVEIGKQAPLNRGRPVNAQPDSE